MRTDIIRLWSLSPENEKRAFKSKCRRVKASLLDPLPASKIGEDVETDLEGKKVNTFMTFIRDCDPISVVGYPAITVPAGYSSTGLPIGLQIVARPFEEPKLLQIANAFEQTTKVRKPPLSKKQAWVPAQASFHSQFDIKML